MQVGAPQLHMLLTPPRLIDILLGTAFMLVSAALYTCSYFIIPSDDPHTRREIFICIAYGYAQSLFGFVSGLMISRMTQVTPASPEIQEEEVTLINKA